MLVGLVSLLGIMCLVRTVLKRTVSIDPHDQQPIGFCLNDRGVRLGR